MNELYEFSNKHSLFNKANRLIVKSNILHSIKIEIFFKNLKGSQYEDKLFVKTGH